MWLGADAVQLHSTWCACDVMHRPQVRSMLSMVYMHKPTVEEDPHVARRIIEATEHPAALDAFARCGPMWQRQSGRQCMNACEGCFLFYSL